MAVFVALVGAACSRPSTTADPEETTVAPARGGRLAVAVLAESNGWNPIINQWAESGSLVGSSMIEPLVILDNDGTPQPWLAERWEASPDFARWDITIRDGVLFHDGTSLDAAAVKRNFDAASQTGLMQFVLGSIYDRIEVTDPRTVRVHLKTPWAQFPTSLPFVWVMAPAMLDRPDAGVTDPVGTGPFRFDHWIQGESLVARRFPQYWRTDDRDERLPYLDEVEFRVINDDGDRERALRSGEVDLMLSNSAPVAESLQAGFDVIRDYNSQYSTIGLNTSAGEDGANPFANVHARRALAYATDRGQITEAVGEGVQSTTTGFRPDGPWAVTDDGYPRFDPARAREEIDAYKAATGAPSLSFTIRGSNAPLDQTLLQTLQRQWAAVGIEATIETVEAAQLLILAILGRYQATMFRYPIALDPSQMTPFHESANAHPAGQLSVNYTRYTSPGIDANAKIVGETADPVRRKAASDAIVREVNSQAVNIWLYNTPTSLAARPQVRGLDSFRAYAIANPSPKPWLGETWLAL